MKKIIDHLNRIFPHLKMINESFLFNNGKDCSPEQELNWNDFIKVLDKNGLEIKFKKNGT